MARALVDTSVLFPASYRRDAAHDDALPILRGVDDGSLPEAVVLDHVLAETLNGLTTHAGSDAAVDFLDRIEGNARFHVAALSRNCRAQAKDRFRRHRSLSYVDACVVAYMRAEGIDHLFALDEGFDAVDGVERLDALIDPSRAG